MPRQSRSYLAADVLELWHAGKLKPKSRRQVDLVGGLLAGLTCAQVARDAGVHRSAVCRMLRRLAIAGSK